MTLAHTQYRFKGPDGIVHDVVFDDQQAYGDMYVVRCIRLTPFGPVETAPRGTPISCLLCIVEAAGHVW